VRPIFDRLTRSSVDVLRQQADIHHGPQRVVRIRFSAYRPAASEPATKSVLSQYSTRFYQLVWEIASWTNQLQLSATVQAAGFTFRGVLVPKPLAFVSTLIDAAICADRAPMGEGNRSQLSRVPHTYDASNESVVDLSWHQKLACGPVIIGPFKTGKHRLVRRTTFHPRSSNSR
jgi:hypothetical protein